LTALPSVRWAVSTLVPLNQGTPLLYPLLCRVPMGSKRPSRFSRHRRFELPSLYITRGFLIADFVCSCLRLFWVVPVGRTSFLLRLNLFPGQGPFVVFNPGSFFRDRYAEVASVTRSVPLWTKGSCADSFCPFGDCVRSLNPEPSWQSSEGGVCASLLPSPCVPIHAR